MSTTRPGATPSRAIGVTLTVGGLLFLAPLRFGVTSGDRPPEGAIIALFTTWVALFGGVGITLRRRWSTFQGPGGRWMAGSSEQANGSSVRVDTARDARDGR